MLVVTTIAEARSVLSTLRDRDQRIGLVPTMGYLHDGHLSLMQRSVDLGCATFVTIFVNPLQFSPTEDLARYPRDLNRDLALCAEVGVAVVLAPRVDEMYRQPVLTTVALPDLARRWEGASRPTHFAGVATVVAKLFNIAGPCTAYFGEKDWQQLQVIGRMASDLSFPVEVVGCPTVRDPDGLALSSRNLFLGPAERQAAMVLSRALRLAQERVRKGEVDPALVRGLAEDMVDKEPLAQLDYVAVVEPATLEPLTRPDALATGTARLLLAARFGSTRLIDNGPLIRGPNGTTSLAG